MDEESHHTFNVRRNTPLPLNAPKKTLPHLSRSQNSDADISQHKQTYVSKLIHEVR